MQIYPKLSLLALMWHVLKIKAVGQRPYTSEIPGVDCDLGLEYFNWNSHLLNVML